MAIFKRTKDKRYFNKAKEIFYKDLIGAPNTYADI